MNPMQIPPGRLDTILVNFATGAVDAQRALDAHHAAEVEAFVAALAATGLWRTAADPANGAASAELIRAIAPAHFRLATQHADVRLKVEVAREWRVGLDVQLAGRIVTSFLEARYGSTRRTGMQVQVDVQAAPAPPPAGPSPT